MIHYVIVGILVVISTILVRTGLHSLDLLPEQASLQARSIDWLFGIHIDLIAFFFSLIVVFLLYSIIVFRRRRGSEEEVGAHFSSNTKLEVIWTIIPLGIVLVLAVLGAQILGDVERRDPGALEVDVTASQWSWRFEYTESGATSSDLVLPVDRQILLRLRSEDVIHSFWVPEFRVKQDVLPGGEDFVRELRITPVEEGEFKLRCAELCGQQHYAMLADVIVVPQADFEIWLEQKAAECDLSNEECGQRWVEDFGCLGCHSLDGSEIVGPTWQGLAGSTVTLADGSQALADYDYLHESIVDPNARLVSGFEADVMPQNFAEVLTPEQIDQIIAFIQSLE